jgi:L-threonylcarbamoyladenylate synthase
VSPLPFQTADEVAAAIPQIVAHLNQGGLLAYPTETVYGLGSRARQADVAALAALKGRSAGKPFLLLISDRSMAEANGLAFNASADALARAFWPGPLTLVLPGGSGRLPDLLRGPDGGIAVRWTSHQAIAKLVAALGGPLTSTSANLPGQLPGGAAAIIATSPRRSIMACCRPRRRRAGNRPHRRLTARPQANRTRGRLSVRELRRASLHPP